MAAFEDVGLVAAEDVAGVVPFGEQLRIVGLRRAAVVAGEDRRACSRRGRACRARRAAPPTASSVCITKSA